jgi:3-demethoxyubiquinol 3-hydroxylase
MSLEPQYPTDLTRQQKIAQMIRVNQAGEDGAARIYDGQLAILKDNPCREAIQHMSEQEKSHLQAFNRLMIEQQVRPTILSPLWHIAGYLLGAGTALLGEKAAMACTVAVEEVIDEHYQSQEKILEDQEPTLKKLIECCRQDEIAHREISLDHGAKETPGYPILSAVIKTGTRLAISLSKRF